MGATRPLRSKLFWIGVLYFSEGFPYGIFHELMPVWFRERGIDLREIGLLSLLGLCWALKFLWAPLIDQYRAHRRWVTAVNLAMAALLLSFSLGFGPWVWIAIAGLALLSATNDIAIDGYTIELLERDELGVANGVRIGLYRVGMLGSGLALVLAGTFGWSAAFTVMPAVLCGCALAVLAAPPERARAGPAGPGFGAELNQLVGDPRLAAAAAALALLALALCDQALGLSESRPGLWPAAIGLAALGIAASAALRRALPEPSRAALSGHPQSSADTPLAEPGAGPLLGALLELGSRPGIAPVLLFVLVFKLPDAAMGFMVKPFWVDAGFPTDEIGWVSVNVGIGLSVAGGLVGGWYTDRAGIFRGLWVLGLAQALSNLGYAGAAQLHAVHALEAPDTWLRAAVYAASATESFTGGLGTGAFLAFLMAMVQRERSATDFALLSSLFALSRSVAGWAGGYGAEHLGYAPFFALSFGLSLPAYALLPWVRRALSDAEERSRQTGTGGAAAGLGPASTATDESP